MTAAWVEKVRRSATSGKLLDHPKLLSLLSTWKEWGSADEPREWCAVVAVEPETLQSWLRDFVAEMTSQGSDSVVVIRRPYIDMKAVDEFVDVAFLEAQVTALPAEVLSDLDVIAVKLLRKAMKRRREGKPDTDRLMILDDED